MTENGNTSTAFELGPSTAELYGLLKKQDDVLSALLAELEAYKFELAIMRNVKISGEPDDETQSKEIMKVGDSFLGGDKKSAVLENFLKDLKKTRLEALDLSRELEVKKIELSDAVEISAIRQAYIDHLNKFLESERDKKNSEFSRLNELLIEKTLECDRLIAENNAKEARLKVLESISASKEKLVNDLMKDVALRRGEEDKILEARLTVLADENMILRNSLLALGANESSSSDVNKLLDQQNKLIEFLKSECAILMNRLKLKRNEHRRERKQFKRQIRNLNNRLESFVAGNND